MPCPTSAVATGTLHVAVSACGDADAPGTATTSIPAAAINVATAAVSCR